MISVITPTYNRADLVQQTIKSIQAQTFTDWEMIIVDDGSTDNTQQAIQPYLADKRISYIKKNNTGQPDSLNVGVSHAKCEFIVFLDSDDEAYTHWLQTVAPYLKEDVAIACAGAIRKLLDGTKIEEGLSDYKLYGKTYRLKFTCGSLFIRRTIFNAIGGYDATMRSAIQTDLGYRLIDYIRKRHYKTVAVEQNLVQINIHAGERIRTNWSRRREGSIQFLNKHFAFIQQNDKREIASLCSTIAFSSYKLKRKKEALRYLLMAIKYHPQRGVNYLRVVKYTLL
ncbi:glycosyltransferase family 2 protein [Ilyomonas limi]|uniref:Glycosyltransferase family 2 protein n=1 Tax=Ilyomonas limi TaxID=2575867 RepID=A0A4U3KRV4_9BACT|nr:glycosyltransferase family A protein [Ilyomonas limi]TKK65030.1 glycosyltransferase family 2 protein [Ilyomonas limi]